MAPRISGPSQPLQPLQASSEIMVISQPTNPPLPVSLAPARWETPFVIHPCPSAPRRQGPPLPLVLPTAPLQVQVGPVNAVEQVLFWLLFPRCL